MLREDSSEALEISGQEMCRFFRFRVKKEPLCLSPLPSSFLVWSGESLPDPDDRCQIQFHLCDEPELRFLCLCLSGPFPLGDSKVPNGVRS